MLTIFFKSNFDLQLLNEISKELSSFLPILLGFLVYCILCWLLLKLVMFFTSKALKTTKTDILFKRVQEIAHLKGFFTSINYEKTFLSTIKYLLLLVFVIVGADVFGFTVVSQLTAKLLGYLPNFFVAILILVGGLYLANQLKKWSQSLLKSLSMGGSKILSHLLFYVIAGVVIITALDQAGVNTHFITGNLMVFFGGFMATFAIALALGSRDIVYRLLLLFYMRKNFYIGQKIKINGVEGEVVGVDNLALILKTTNEKFVIPIKQVSNAWVEIKD